MIAQKNISHFFYNGAHTLAAAVAAPTSANQVGIRRIGESLCDATALVSGDYFQVLYMDTNGKVSESPMYSWSDLVSKNKVAISALVSQVTNIGWNGTDGDIVATNGGDYLITIGFRDLLKQVGGKRLYKYAEYQAGTSAKNYDIAIALADSLVQNMAKDAFQRIVPKVIASPTVVAANVFAHDCTVVQYSKYITVGTNSQYNTTVALAVGDYVRLGAAAGSAPVAATASVYRVVELTSSTVFKVDRPIVEPSGTYANATADTEVIAKATMEVAASYFGLQLTGNDSAAPFVPGMFGPNLIMFTVGVSPDFSTTQVRLTTSPFPGVATQNLLTQLDWELRANTREPYRIAEWLVTASNNVSTTPTYLRTFIFKDKSTQAIDGVAESFLTLYIGHDATGSANLDTVFTQ